MRSGLTPRSSRRSATQPNELPDRPGPSSTMANGPSWAESRARSAAEGRSRRANGGPVGLNVTAARAPVAAAATAARPVPMLRRPITSGRPPQSTARAAWR